VLVHAVSVGFAGVLFVRPLSQSFRSLKEQATVIINLSILFAKSRRLFYISEFNATITVPPHIGFRLE
jgi:hypothetical protein